jgi:LacI family transcriptional regulator
VTALRFIREHACDGITVSDVLRVVPMSRRILEHRFQKFVRRTPHAEIIRIRMDRVARLLRETELPLIEIAARSGFAAAEYLSVAFKKYTGQSPRAYRQKFGRSARSRQIEAAGAPKAIRTLSTKEDDLHSEI